MKTNTIRLTYEETDLLTRLLQKEITELGVERDPRFSEYYSALQKLSEEKRSWYSQKSYFSTYETLDSEGGECD
mgnify:FL=1